MRQHDLQHYLEKSSEPYAKSGYCLFPGLLSPGELGEALAWIEAQDRKGESVNPGLEPEFESSLALEGQKKLRKLRRLLWNDRPFWEALFRRTGILDLGAYFVGVKLCIVFHAAFMKPSRIGSEIALHQDQALWRHQYPGAISMWFALSPCTIKNGCLEVCAGSHRRGLIPHKTHPSYPWHPSLRYEEVGLPKPEPLEVQAGDTIVWHRCLLVHGSGPNLSAYDRRSMVIVFADAIVPGFTATDEFYYIV
jgi:hypothetical protein